MGDPNVVAMDDALRPISSAVDAQLQVRRIGMRNASVSRRNHCCLPVEITAALSSNWS